MNINLSITRRTALGGLAALAGSLAGTARGSSPAQGFRLATFSTDVTIPLGHPCMGGGVEPASEIRDPLLARGIVLLGLDHPLVVVAVDWCEIRNDAFDRWRSLLAEAAGTTPERVLVNSIHQHDAPVVDLEAERLLLAHGAQGSVCDLDFHEHAVQKVAADLRASLPSARRVTEIGLGSAPVDRVASNRRYLLPDGQPSFSRGSATRDPYAQAQPEGIIDPLLRTLSFWDDDQPLAALHSYAVHPMSTYGRGAVSSDFVGLARTRRQADDPTIFQMYFSGCSGNVTAGKYNDGSPEYRDILADRLHRAMIASWQSTQRSPLERVSFRSVPLNLPPRSTDAFTPEALLDRLKHDPKPFGQCLAALGLSWRKRSDAGRPIDLPAIDFGPAQLVLLPGEAYVEYQLLAQQLRPDQFIMALGYGECAPGYIPTDQAVSESDTNLSEWCWVAPGAEPLLRAALADALNAPR
ncbi:hypothetical protein [Tautonia marina]|uniref:hypothetical protein n=1 Tax=Tautonia marina TaxID=2653855 RepID=UPI0012606649|nr:hypothetical protein [Tautonia marina]